MNERPKRIGWIEIMLEVACVGLLLCGTAPTAQAQVTPTSLVELTGLPASIAQSAASNTTVTVTVKQDRNLTLTANFAGSGAGTDPLTLYLYPTVDGTNYATAAGSAFIWPLAANGTTQVIGVTNIPKSALEGYRALIMKTITNASGTRTIYLTNVVAGWRP